MPHFQNDHSQRDELPKIMKEARRERAKQPRVESGVLPSRDEVLAFIAGERAPEGAQVPARIGKREIARAFGVKGPAKADLKVLLKDLQADGAIQRGRKSFHAQ